MTEGREKGKRERERPSRVEDALFVGDEDVDAVDVAAVGGDAVGELGHDPHRVRALEHVHTLHGRCC